MKESINKILLEVLNEVKPIIAYHSTYADFDKFKEGINYFAQNPEYSKEIAKIINVSGKSSDYNETRKLRTITVKLYLQNIYDMPKGEEINDNIVRDLLSKPEFTKQYDAIRGIDLYSDNEIVYAVWDNKKIKIINKYEKR